MTCVLLPLYNLTLNIITYDHVIEFIKVNILTNDIYPPLRIANLFILNIISCLTYFAERPSHVKTYFPITIIS